MSIVFKQGNIFDSNCDVIVNTINCVGVMGKGIALEFKKKYPKMFDDYKKRCSLHSVRPGAPYLYLLDSNNDKHKYILNFPTKDHWRAKSKMDYVISGMQWFCNNFKQFDFKSIAFPALGCGNGGLSFDDVRLIMVEYLQKLDLDIEIYEPEIKSVELSHSRLSKKSFVKAAVKRADVSLLSNANSKKETIAIDFSYSLPILSAIKEISYRAPEKMINRELVFKIAYLLHFFCGEKNGDFVYSISESKIYSSSVSSFLDYWVANGILIQDHYNNLFLRSNFDFCEDFSNNYVEAIYKTVDLVLREKYKNQSDVDLALIYFYDNLREKKKDISDDELFETVTHSGLNLKHTPFPELKNSSLVISSAIVNLTMRKVLEVRFSGKVEYGSN